MHVNKNPAMVPTITFERKKNNNQSMSFEAKRRRVISTWIGCNSYCLGPVEPVAVVALRALKECCSVLRAISPFVETFDVYILLLRE
jgi:hypothetical protein